MTNFSATQWNNNEPFKSCVPVGVYNLYPFSSPRYGHTFALRNEIIGVTPFKTNFSDRTNRYAILLHSANWARQLQGCIAPGKTLVTDGNGDKMVTSSVQTVRDLLPRLNESTMVEIVNEGDWQ
jgi:hypothetical protein